MISFLYLSCIFRNLILLWINVFEPQSTTFQSCWRSKCFAQGQCSTWTSDPSNSSWAPYNWVTWLLWMCSRPIESAQEILVLIRHTSSHSLDIQRILGECKALRILVYIARLGIDNINVLYQNYTKSLVSKIKILLPELKKESGEGSRAFWCSCFFSLVHLDTFLLKII